VTDASGKFALSTLTAGDGALVGKHTVTISEYYAPGKAPPMPGMGSTLPSRFPSKYSEPTQTPFTNVVVEAKGKNDFPFDIKD
jgi:hypothetical protein